MVSLLRQLISAIAITATIASANNAVTKDMVFVGGGASGAYAAFRLREDYGKSVALIEKQNILVSSDHFADSVSI